VAIKRYQFFWPRTGCTSALKFTQKTALGNSTGSRDCLKYDTSAQVGLMKMKKATDFKTILAKDQQTSLFLKQVQRRLFGW